MPLTICCSQRAAPRPPRPLGLGLFPAAAAFGDPRPPAAAALGDAAPPLALPAAAAPLGEVLLAPDVALFGEADTPLALCIGSLVGDVLLAEAAFLGEPVTLPLGEDGVGAGAAC